MRHLLIGAGALVLALGVGSVACADDGAQGTVTGQGSVGKTPPGCEAHYDPAKGEYRITGGGDNMWAAADAFYFVWKRASGDMTLTADVSWVGTGAVAHRKAVLMIRQTLDADAAYLQYRLITPPLIAALHRLGLGCYAWTVDASAVARTLVSWGVDGMTTSMGVSAGAGPVARVAASIHVSAPSWRNVPVTCSHCPVSTRAIGSRLKPLPRGRMPVTQIAASAD